MCELCARLGYDIHGDGFQINSTTSGDQTGPNAARLADGRFIVLYQSSDIPANGIDIRARIFNADGTPSGTDFVVSTTIAGDQTAPAILVNSNDTLSLLWQTPDLAIPGNTQLMERSFDLSGNPLGPEHQVSTSGADGAYSFTQRASGTIFIVYENNGDIYGRTFDANWSPLTAEVQLNTSSVGTQAQARLVVLTNGNILVGFQSDDNADGGGGSGNVIRNRVFSTAGDAWTPVSINGSTNDFVVNTTGADDQTRERLSRLGDGRVLEVWQSDDTGDGSGTAIRARIISATGDPTAAGSDFIINTTTTGDQLRPAILGFEDGRRLVYWHSFESGTDTIRGRFVHANGTLDAADFIIAALADTSIPTFALALLANQHMGFMYQGVSSGDGLGAGIQGAIGSVGSLPLSSPFVNTGVSSFDLALPSYSMDQAAAQISRGNAPWNDVLGSSHTLTYSYRATSAGVSYTNGASGFSQFNAAQIAAAEVAIQLWEDVANATLTRVQDPGSEYSDSGQFLLWNYASSTAGSQAANASGFGGAVFTSGAWRHHVYLNDDRTLVTAPAFDNDGFRLFLHEIGHALGLSHPGNYNILPGGASVVYDGNAIYRQDTDQYTVMSYFDESITHANFVDTFAMTPLLHDIAALQRLYGANTTIRAGDTTYGFNSNAGAASYAIASSSQHAVFAVWDGGGTDTLDFSGYSAQQVITLVPEQFSSVGGLEFNVAIAQGTVIENAIGGTGADYMTGNGAANTLNGGPGADVMAGGAGNDTYYVDNVGDVVTENASEGTDTVHANFSYILAANVEQLFLEESAGAATGVGNGEQNLLVGNSFDNALDGGANNDTLQGGVGNDTLQGGTGTDGMIGGIGNDTYFVDSVFDVIVENAGEGIDTVYSNSNYIIGTNVEQLYLQESGGTATGVGNGEQNLIVGNSFDNVLDGGSNNDQLEGGGGNDTLEGGTGTDGMIGGTGNDTYFVDSVFDVIVENAGGGIDTVYTNSNYIIGANVEQLYLQESGGTATGVGNGERNLIVGNSFNNALDGGSNNDTLQGGGGDDTLFGGTGIDGLFGEAGNDHFVFNPGTAAGDVIVDFNGNGAAAGDHLSFVGFGGGATFTNQDATHWVLTYSAGANTEVITFQNAATIDTSDFQFL